MLFNQSTTEPHSFIINLWETQNQFKRHCVHCCLEQLHAATSISNKNNNLKKTKQTAVGLSKYEVG